MSIGALCTVHGAFLPLLGGDESAVLTWRPTKFSRLLDVSSYLWFLGPDVQMRAFCAAVLLYLHASGNWLHLCCLISTFALHSSTSKGSLSFDDLSYDQVTLSLFSPGIQLSSQFPIFLSFLVSQIGGDVDLVPVLEFLSL